MATELLTPTSLGGLRIEKVAQLESTFSALIYGDYGAGKTCLSGDADAVPEMRKVILLDVEGGTKSLRRSHPDIEVVRVRTWSEMQDVYNALYARPDEYRTAIVDSLTEIQYINMESILGTRDELEAEEKAGWEEYRQSLSTMRKFVRAMRDLPMNTIFTALAGEERDKKTGRSLIKPQFTGKFKQEVGGLLDEVWYLYIKEVDGKSTHLLLTTKTETTVAKSRSDLPPVIVEPNMAELYKQLTKEAT